MNLLHCKCANFCGRESKDLTDGDKVSTTYIQYKYPTLSSNGYNSLIKSENHTSENGGPNLGSHFSSHNGSVKTATRERQISKNKVLDKKRNKGHIHLGRAIVELTKYDEGNFGITISASTKKKKRIRIISIKPGSPAHRSDVLDIGDCLVSVNGHKITKPKPAYVAELLKHSGNTVQLEIEYRLPELYSKHQFLTRGTFFVKNVNVKLKRDEHSSFGFNVRGGLQPDRPLPWPLVITKVRNGGPADREGSIKLGDRLILIDNINITNATLTEALSLIKHCAEEAIFTIEYDTIYYDKIQTSQPFLLEIEKPVGISLGISMFVHRHGTKSYICISGVKPASIADRCGALKSNDAILTIDDMSTNGMTVPEANRLIKYNKGKEDNVIKLEVLKNFSTFCNSDLNIWSNAASGNSSKEDEPLFIQNRNLILEKSSSLNSEKTESSLGSLPCFKYNSKAPVIMTRNINKKRPSKGKPCDSEASYSSMSTILIPSYQVCHSETTEVLLKMGPNGLGLALKNSGTKESDRLFYTIISGIESESVAEKSGVIQMGDRILSVNGESAENTPAHRVVDMITSSPIGPNSDPPIRYCTLKIEFDVAESIVPTSGIFLIQISKRGSPDLGLSLMAPKKRKLGEPLIISQVKKGSPAYRLGTIQPGDKFLAVDNISVLYHTLQEAVDILRTSGDLIKLKIQKDDTFSDEYDTLTNSVIYSVEVCKNGGPLGLALSGSEEPFDNPIKVSAITPGGIIDKTGAIHVEDKLLAINGDSLRGKSLNDALCMLDTAGDNVVLKICKNKPLNSVYGECGEQQYQQHFANYDKLFLENYPYQSRHLGGCLPMPPYDHRYDGLRIIGNHHHYQVSPTMTQSRGPLSTGPLSNCRDRRNGIVWMDYPREDSGHMTNYEFDRDGVDNHFAKMAQDLGQPNDLNNETVTDNTPVQSVDSAVESLDSSGGEAHSPPILGADDDGVVTKPVLKYPSPPPLLLYDASVATSITPHYLLSGLGGLYTNPYTAYCDHGRIRQSGLALDNSNLYHHCRRPKRPLVARHSSTSCGPSHPDENYSTVFKGQSKLNTIASLPLCPHREVLSDTAVCHDENMGYNQTRYGSINRSPLSFKPRRSSSYRSSSPDPFYSSPYFPPKCQEIASTFRLPSRLILYPSKTLSKDKSHDRDHKLSIKIPENHVSTKMSQKLTVKPTPKEVTVIAKKTTMTMSDEWNDLLKNLDNFGESELLKHIEEAILGEGKTTDTPSSNTYIKPIKSSYPDSKKVDTTKLSEIMTANLNPWYLRNGPRLLGLKGNMSDPNGSIPKGPPTAFPILYKVHLVRELLGTKFSIEISENPQNLGFIVASVREIAIIGKKDYNISDIDLQSFRMLRPMDTILQINGLSTENLSWERIIKQLESTTKPNLELSLGRDNVPTKDSKQPSFLQNQFCRKYVLRNIIPVQNPAILPSTVTRKCISSHYNKISKERPHAELSTIKTGPISVSAVNPHTMVASVKSQDGEDRETSTSTLNTVIYTTLECDINLFAKSCTTSSLVTEMSNAYIKSNDNSKKLDSIINTL